MRISFLLVFILSIFISGCATGVKPMYEYGSYSESYYAMKKESGTKSTNEWKIALEEIITKSNAEALRVPPGVYANLGYLSLKLNNKTQAVSYFEEEKRIYPEAEKFMTNLINKTLAQGE